MMSLLVLALVAGSSWAIADEAPAPDPAPTHPVPAAQEEPAPADAVDEELVVTPGTSLEARRRLEQVIQAEHYGAPKYREDYVLLRPDTPWYPSIHLHQDGLVSYHWRPLRKSWMWLMGDLKKARRKRENVAVDIHPALVDWREALAGECMQTRYAEIPELLQALWDGGTPLEAYVVPLQSYPERRQALLTFWASRTHTPEGDQVRQLVEDFLLNVVQDSPWPVTAAERAAANATCDCPPGLLAGISLPGDEP